MVFWEDNLTVPGHEVLLPQRSDVRPLLLPQREPFWDSQQYQAVNNFIIAVIIWEANRILPFILMIFYLLLELLPSLSLFLLYTLLLLLFYSHAVLFAFVLSSPLVQLVFPLCLVISAVCIKLLYKWHGICTPHSALLHAFFIYSRCKWQQCRLESPAGTARKSNTWSLLHQA